MTASTYHHVCLLVPDMEKAVAWFSDTLGITFRGPQRVTTQGRIDPGYFGDEEPHEGQSYITYSIDGPPYYELGEATGKGLHDSARHGVGLQHVGMFVDDVDAVMADLAKRGIGTEARMVTPDGKTLVCWTERAPETGLMVEYIDRSLEAPTQSWIETGVFPTTASSAPAES